MSDIVIIRHVAHEGPGYLADVLEANNLDYQLVRVDAGEPIPSSVAAFGGIVFMGGPMSVNDPLPWIDDAVRLIRLALEAEVPVLGHCLGGQLIAKAMDAVITRNKVPEFGWHPIQCIDSAETASWISGLPEYFDVFHWHGETFSLPSGAQHLFRSDFCAHQGFVSGPTLALQCHIEMTGELVDDWVARADPGQLDGRPSTPDAATILADTPIKLESMRRHASTLYQRWFEGLN